MFKTNHHTPKTVQANSLPFEPLMEKLQANGFAVGVKDFIEFIKIFEAFETESADDLKYYLAPLICRCQEEQQAFYRIFDQWISDQYDRNQQIRTVQANKKRKILIYSLLCLLALVAIWFLVKPSPCRKLRYV